MSSIFQNIRKIVNGLGRYSKYVRWAYLVAVLEAGLIFVPYGLFFYSVQVGLSRAYTMNDFYFVLVGMILSVAVRSVLRRIMDKLQQDKGYYAFAEKRLELTDHLAKLHMGYYSEGNIGNMTAVVTTDITFIEEAAMMQLALAVSNIASILPTSAMMFLYDYRLGLTYLFFLVLALVALEYLLKKMRSNARARQDNLGKLSHGVINYVRGLPTIKAFNIGQEKSNEITENIQEVQEGSLRFVRDMYGAMIFSGLTLSLPTAFIASLMAYYAMMGKFDLSGAIGIIVFAFVLFTPLQLLNTSAEMLELGKASMERFEELMKTPELHNRSDNPFQPETMEIEFKHVSFAYEKKTVLQDINLHIRPKTFTALVGRSGSGKTTIANLIARFWDVEEGEILIDGENIRNIAFENLMENISMVFQRVYLFHDTIYNNIAFGSASVTREDVIAAAKKARCHDFIMKLEHGYDTIVGEGGSTLSGGEKQRISIARAILKDAPLILLDEATAGIDPENEKFIQEAIDELVRDRTLVVIAHRLATIRKADNIVYLEDGKIVEQGTHDELLALGGQYKRQHDFYLQNLEG
ncbi:MAG: ABC transporter ATP-binding protein [Bacillota bacterium]|nr:ABC transporter ATP-binding protein [Bacillota bacterium]